MLIAIDSPITLEANWCDSFVNFLINWSSSDCKYMWGITYGEYWTIITGLVLEFILYYILFGFICTYTNISKKWKKILFWYKIIISIILALVYCYLLTTCWLISGID